MYGPAEGRTSLLDRMSKMSDEGLEVPVTEGLLRTSPHVLSLGRPRAVELARLFTSSPNISLTGEKHHIDPGKVPQARHTRDGPVVSLVNSTMQTGPGKVKINREALQEADRWINYGGAIHGWQARVALHGCNEKQAGDMIVYRNALSTSHEWMPLNRVHTIKVTPEWYKPNFKASTGMPNPDRSKEQDEQRIMGALAKIENQASYGVVTEYAHWDVGYFMLKKELHDLDKLDKKARAYYCFPGVTSTAVGAFLSHWTKKCLTFVDDPNCTNLVGVSFFNNGATRLVQQLFNVERSAAAYYGDDCLMVIIMPSGRRYLFLPDVAAMDMNTPDRYKDLWLEHIAKHWVGEPDDSLFSSGLALYAELLRNARYLLPGGVFAHFHNFATTGLTANTYYQTFVNSIVWQTHLKPLIEAMASRMDAGASAADDFTQCEEICAALYAEMREVGLPWKPGAQPLRLRKQRLRGILGHDLEFNRENHNTLASVPLPRLVASLINPGRVPNKSGTAMMQAYNRSVSLMIAGGYQHPAFVNMVDVLFHRAVAMAPCLNPEHRVKLCEMEPMVELNLGHDEVHYPSSFVMEGNKFMVRRPPTVQECVALRLEENEGGVSAAMIALVASCEPARPSIRKKVEARNPDGSQSGQSPRDNQKPSGGQRKLAPFKRKEVPGKSDLPKPAKAGEAKSVKRKKKKGANKKPAGVAKEDQAPQSANSNPADRKKKEAKKAKRKAQRKSKKASSAQAAKPPPADGQPPSNSSAGGSNRNGPPVT